MEELYYYLLTTIDLKGYLKLNEDYILYYRHDLGSDMNEFYKDCIDDKNLIKDNLPNGFKLDNFNYDKDYLSFEILKQ